jgi:hypothetical protein
MKISSIQTNRMNDIKRNLSFSIGELNVLKNDIPESSIQDIASNTFLIITLQSQIDMLNVSLEVLESIS